MRAAPALIPPPGHDPLGAWTFDPLTTGLLAALMVAVGLGAWRARQDGITWSPWRAVSLATGVASAIVAIDAWPGVYAKSLMSVLVSQQLVLLLISPVLIAFGRPLVPLRALVPRPSTPAPLSSALRVVTYPLLGPLLVPAVLGVVVFSPLLEQQRQHAAVAYAIHLGLLLVGLAVAAPLARDTSKISSLAFGLALSVGLVELLLDAIPGIALRLDGHVLPGVAALATTRTWGPSPLGDQQTAGAILWSVAEILDLPFLLLVIGQWFRADAREARVVDAQLDAAAAEQQVRRPVTVEEALGAEPEAEPLREIPWWEVDGRVFGDGRTRAFRESRRRRDNRERDGG